MSSLSKKDIKRFKKSMTALAMHDPMQAFTHLTTILDSHRKSRLAVYLLDLYEPIIAQAAEQADPSQLSMDAPLYHMHNKRYDHAPRDSDAAKASLRGMSPFVMHDVDQLLIQNSTDSVLKADELLYDFTASNIFNHTVDPVGTCKWGDVIDSLIAHDQLQLAIRRIKFRQHHLDTLITQGDTNADPRWTRESLRNINQMGDAILAGLPQPHTQRPAILSLHDMTSGVTWVKNRLLDKQQDPHQNPHFIKITECVQDYAQQQADHARNAKADNVISCTPQEKQIDLIREFLDNHVGHSTPRAKHIAPQPVAKI